jgi:membrane-bound inhibitor of C-type lysozyme
MGLKLRTILLLSAGIAVSACGGVDVWPFKSDKGVERSRVPANATEYQCAANKKFYVRRLEGGTSVWLILPERELRLDRQGSEGNRYGNGVAVLDLSGSEASLTDGSAPAYAGCKTTATPAAN